MNRINNLLDTSDLKDLDPKIQEKVKKLETTIEKYAPHLCFPMEVFMINPKTFEEKKINIGFSIEVCIFSIFFGAALFYRKLYTWAGVFFFLTLMILNLKMSQTFVLPEAILHLVLQVVWITLAIYIGFKANELSAKQYLSQGWKFVTPESKSVKYAKKKWKL